MSRSGPWIHGDVSSPEIVEEFIQHHQPATIFHLAAASTTNHDALYENNPTIGIGTININEQIEPVSISKESLPEGQGFIITPKRG